MGLEMRHSKILQQKIAVLGEINRIFGQEGTGRDKESVA